MNRPNEYEDVNVTVLVLWGIILFTTFGFVFMHFVVLSSYLYFSASSFFAQILPDVFFLLLGLAVAIQKQRLPETSKTAKAIALCYILCFSIFFSVTGFLTILSLTSPPPHRSSIQNNPFRSSSERRRSVGSSRSL